MSADIDVTRGWRAMVTHGLDGLTNDQITTLVQVIQKRVPEVLLLDKLFLIPNAGEGLTLNVHHWYRGNGRLNGHPNAIGVHVRHDGGGLDYLNENVTLELPENQPGYYEVGREIEKTVEKALLSRYPLPKKEVAQ